MKDKPDILTILGRLPGASVGTMTDKLGEGTKVIDMIDDVLAIAGHPANILEIGTHKGGSATIWLARSEAILTSLDIGGEWVGLAEHEKVVKVLSAEFPGRFIFHRLDSTSPEAFVAIKDTRFGLSFIDGHHVYSYAKKDIETSIALGIPYILIDDYTTCEDCRRAAADTGLIHIKTYEAVHNPANIGVALFRAP